MDEKKEYAAFSIPKREPRPENGATAPAANIASVEISFENANFAEIELETSPNRAASGDTALLFYASVAQPQPIEQRAADPVRQKFFDMRSLASDRPFARNDSELFYRQAKFMEDYTDDFEGNAKFFMYYPYYQHMGYEHLRTYFTWRTKARQGDIRPTSLSYVFLYVYELLSGIGVDDPLDGLNKLVAVWKAFSDNENALDKYLPRWLKDYHVYYELAHSFQDFIDEHDMQKYYSLMLILEADTENRLELWNSLSSYDITKSKFYIEENKQLIEDCFVAVLDGINEFCAARDANIEDMLIYRVSNRTPWYPFRQALFYDWLNQPDRTVIIPGQERYYCNNNRWTASLPIYYSSQRDFIGYIIKKTESCLRETVKYKYKLAADLKPGPAFRELKELDAKNSELGKVIEKSVKEYHRELTRTVVTVDHENLARIRKEASGTLDKLIVPEDDNRGQGLEVKSQAAVAMLNVVPSPPSLRGAEGDAAIHAPVLPPDIPDDDPWLALKDALNATELQALTMALSDSLSVKAFADENGIMLEVLADGINEKAADYIGDSILEIGEGMDIYEEYKENIRQML